MKCETIRDLLPLCLDGLASEEAAGKSRNISRVALPAGRPPRE